MRARLFFSLFQHLTHLFLDLDELCTNIQPDCPAVSMSVLVLPMNVCIFKLPLMNPVLCHNSGDELKSAIIWCERIRSIRLK
jgi:hypothetical protein